MASNFKETAVKTVIVERKRLQETLSANLETHKTEYREAVIGYEQARGALIRALHVTTVAAMDKNSSETRGTIHKAYDKFSRLEKPIDNSNSYTQAIRLMEWETRDKIELSINDFECYVENNWGWMATFKTAHANFSNSH